MGLKKDLGDMPKEPKMLTTGRVADPSDVSEGAVEAWFDDWSHREGFVKPMSIENRVFRASWAGLRCDRALWYAICGEEESTPASVADHWRMAIGTMAHSLLQGDHLVQALARLHDKDVQVTFEAAIDLEPLGLSGAASADVLAVWQVTDGDQAWEESEVIEIKTVGGFAFKKMTQRFKGGPTGPRKEHVIQGALAAAATGSQMRLMYLSTELVSAGLAKSMGLSEAQRFSAEWVYSKEEVQEIAAREVERVNRVIGEVMVPAPVIRDDDELTVDDTEVAEVTSPNTGAVTVHLRNGGMRFASTWRCDYCRFKGNCLEDGGAWTPGGDVA